MLPPIFWALALFTLQVASQRCNSTSPCEQGCCSSYGYCGFGPDHCGDGCISDCDRKSECNPGFGSEWAVKDKCPLNICCSEYGYCGVQIQLTKEHCGDRRVQQPTCSKNSGNNRVVGYYEGWAPTRQCNSFRPEQIPVPLYTHINFAFATIDPKSFQVHPASRADIGLYRRLMLLKNIDPQLKIYISLGGQAFNDAGPTATTFSDLATSVPNQKAFIESLVSFVSTYGFDGVDLDWQYPGVEERSGRSEDYANFPQMVSRLRQSLDAADKGITITTPASFRHLRHFDLRALSRSVDWFNVMTYDLHGTWDKGEAWTGPVLNAHNNLTEIDQALDLFWRNDISAEKVVMGLGFYGRSFTASSSSCLEPGCSFESAGESGKCSRDVGVLLNSEIDELVEEHAVTPKLYKDAAVKVAAWDDQWVAYEDEETLKLKSEFAQSRCLGGLMVWSISHDTADAKYSKALGRVANNREVSHSLEKRQDNAPAYEFDDIQNPQCKWTNCGEGCPRGWTHIKRTDGGARDGEYMFDESGCNGKGVGGAHSFCCPAGQKQPECGWYGHNNGKCVPSCPDGMGVVGGNSKYCNNNGYQAACCTTDVKPMTLYTTCSLGSWPYCDLQEGCPPSSGDSSKDTLLAESGSGMGGAVCRRPGSNQRSGKMKICCDTSDNKKTFSQCEWSSGCDGSCPSDKVRIALDTEHPDCFPRGGKARCCKPAYYDTIEVENPKLEEYRDELDRYLESPVCWNSSSDVDWSPNPAEPLPGDGDADDSSLFRRWLFPSITGPLERASASPGQRTTHEMCVDLMVLAGSTSMLDMMEEIWNEKFAGLFSNLRASTLRNDVKDLPEYSAQGPLQVCQDLICSPYSWNNRMGNAGARTNCTDGFCALNRSEDRDDCNDEDDSSESRLVKRIRTYTHPLRAPDGRQGTIVTTLPGYLSLSRLDNTEPVRRDALDYESFDDCGNLRLVRARVNQDEGDDSYYNMEHPFDGVLINRFFQDAAAGNLRSGATAQTGHVSLSFFEQARTTLPDPPPLPVSHGTAADYGDILDRVMECLGSETNRANFVLVFKDINASKTYLMQGGNPVSEARWEDLASDPDQIEYLLMKLKAAISVITYLNRDSAPNANERLTNIVNAVGTQLAYAQQVYNQNRRPEEHIQILEYWREWTRDFFGTFLIEHTQTFCRGLMAVIRKYWATRTGAEANEVLEKLRIMDQAVDNFRISIADFD